MERNLKMKMDIKEKFLPDDLDAALYRDLEIIKIIPQRDPVSTQKARARFLTEMNSICGKNVIKNSNLRHTKQSNVKTGFHWFGKELSPMFTQIVLALMIALSVLGGGGAGAVYASQSSLPGDFLYPVKMLSEDVQLNWTTDPARQLEMNMEMAQERLQEMEQVKLANREIPEETFKGVYTHLENSLQLGARLYADDPEAQLKLSERVQMQVQNAEQFGPSAVSPEVQQLQQQLREQLRAQERAGQEEETTPEPDAGDVDETSEPEDPTVNLEADTLDQDQDQDQDQDRDQDQLHDQDQDQDRDQTQLKLQDQSCTPVAPASGQSSSSQQQNQGDTSNSQSGNQSSNDSGSNSDNGNSSQKGKK
jgi:hypothetical protein